MFIKLRQTSLKKHIHISRKFGQMMNICLSLSWKWGNEVLHDNDGDSFLDSLLRASQTCEHSIHSHRIHGTIVYLPKHKRLISMVNVGKYSSPMDHTGFLRFSFHSFGPHPTQGCPSSSSLGLTSPNWLAQRSWIWLLFSRWWFQTFFIFTPIWARFPFWLIFFKGLKPPASFCLNNFLHGAIIMKSQNLVGTCCFQP